MSGGKDKKKEGISIYEAMEEMKLLDSVFSKYLKRADFSAIEQTEQYLREKGIILFPGKTRSASQEPDDTNSRS